MKEKLLQLASQMEGELYSDLMMRTLYATDASAYREMPLAVALPRNESDIHILIRFALEHDVSLIPRTAGTSLAGQVVGAGIVVDVSRYFTAILDVNTEEQWVKVQPGVIRDELNMFLKPLGLYFGPETSTANRAMIGGMVGNNSCGSNSLIYGSTREHTLEVSGFLSDGSRASFKALSFDDFISKCEQTSLEGDIYRQIRTILGDYRNQEEIRRQFPKPGIHRRNTGYAIDLLLEADPFTAGGEPFNFCKLICGSEGTLFFMTEIKLHVDRLRTDPTGLLCVHFRTLDEALRANLVALAHAPLVSELMDHYILECTANNLEQRQNRFFVQGMPEAILIVEYEGRDEADIRAKIAVVESAMRSQGLGYYFPIVFGPDRKKVWDLRKAGLGLLSNMPGDEKPVAVIEDTAVAVEDLPAYIADFNAILSRYGLYSVHYAHAATGELHLRPILNLKTQEGNQLFREIATEIAQLVKRYRGSLSGEHGDGRLRGEFIPYMIGQRNYQLLKDIKTQWDPNGIFNPGKIVDSPPMNTFLRYDPQSARAKIETIFRYPGQDILGHAEQCNGSGDCRKSELSGGTMCPSYMASRNEKDTTRARANVLREFLTHSSKDNPFDHPEIREVMDLCLSCKGCKIECPSSVDMAKMKADFLQRYYDSHGIPLRSRMIGNVDKVMGWMAYVPGFYNWSVQHPWVGKLARRTLGFAEDRSLPLLGKIPLRKWFLTRDKPIRKDTERKGALYFFCDEFTNYNDLEIGQKSILLLERLGYEVLMISHAPSGRALLSKGLLREAKKLANRNVRLFSSRITAETPLLAVEPSAILTFRDEYVDLVDTELEADARHIAPHAMLIEEFLVREFEKGNIGADMFDQQQRRILLHTHCQQKAWKLQGYTESALKIPMGTTVQVVPSGCCGMAGSFGYEREHYELSMKIGNLVLFPAVLNKMEGDIVVAPGTSCRHQIKDGTGATARHPVEVLYEALV